MLVHKYARVASEAPRMAGDVQHGRAPEAAITGSTSLAPARGGSSSTLSYFAVAQDAAA